MTCPEWELEIASESGRPELAGHLAGCEHCRAFAREIELDRAALASLALPQDALGVVPGRVLGELRARRRRKMFLGWAAAAACLAALAFGLLVRPRAPENPTIVIASPSAPRLTVWSRTTPHPHRRPPARTLARSAEPIVIKMFTEDPDVVIIWLVDKKGDSL